MSNWVQDAVFYELDIRAFFDGNGDGHGDFEGATQKLDYLYDLGVTALLITPIPPTPPMEEGLSEIKIPAPYGSAEAAEAFIQTSQEKGLKVLIQVDTAGTQPVDQEKLSKRLRYWLFLGVDGFELNVPDGHEAAATLLKTVRSLLNDEETEPVLIGKLSQPQAQSAHLLDATSSCQLLEDRQLLASLLMSIKQENKKNLIRFLDNMPIPPAGCHWKIGLRDQNMIPLGPLAPQEGRWMLSQYGPENDADRENGITQRLAPLIENHKGKWLILQSILMSLIGVPSLYYGEEIGMGNQEAGGQASLPAPLQWGDGKNGQFSESEETYFPVNEDREYGYHAVNIAQQDSDSASFLNAIRFLLQVRHSHAELRRGETRLWETTSRAVFAYWRTDQENQTLCLYNLSSEVQSVYLYFPELSGRLVDLLHDGKWWSLDDVIPPVLKMRPFASHWLHVQTAPG